jgi:hypothetical protein
METISHSQEVVRNRQRVSVLEDLLVSFKKTTLALVQHNLGDLEQCLEQAAQGVAQLSALRKSTSPSVEGISCWRELSETDSCAERLAVVESFKRVAQEIKETNRHNAVLIDSGLRFSHTMLSILCPPSTYWPLGHHQSPANADIPFPSLISVKS